MKKIERKTDKTLRGLYLQAKSMKPEVSPGQLFIDEVAELTHRAETTVRMWIYGKQTPDDFIKTVLSKHFGIPVEELFPPKKKKT